MVRVISVHHFTRQDVTGLDRVGGHGVTRGRDNLIFIGGQHKIEIHDLKQGASIKGSFPTVDLVQQLVYCKKGNFVCTLENKPARHGGDHFYVRVYLNWEKENSDQPMTARIAGRVTPGSQSGLDVLEMIEIPTRRPVDFIACCQSTGNIALASGMTLCIFKYHLKTHDISKIKFVDFDEMLELDVAFIIKEVAITEDVIGLISETEAHIFQIILNSALLKIDTEENVTEETISPTKNSSSRSKSRSMSKSPGRASESSMTPFRGNKVILNESNMQLIRKADNYINLAESKWIPTLSYGKKKKDSNDKYLLFPSLVGPAQCGVVTEPGEVFGPICSNQCCNVRIKLLSGHGASQRVTSGIFEAITLVYRKIDHITEPDLPFSNLNMSCIYNDLKKNYNKNSTHPLLPNSSEKCSQKTGMSVFLTTPHIGRLYHVSLATNPMDSYVVRGGLFSYTAPVDTVALEPCLLHALTLTGLETYTLRPHPQIIETVIPSDHEMIVPPHWEESVCLVGLRPFLNVESLTLTDSCLALIAANDEGGDKSHTTYSLHLPSASNLYKEMIRVGLGYRASSPSTYFHLLLEAHIVLITAIKCQRNQEDLRMIPEDEDSEDLVSLLQDSSALLGDYYASCNSEIEWKQAVQYFKSSNLAPDVILERLSTNNPGLIYVIKTLLLRPNAPILSATQTNFILDVLEKIAPEEVSILILKASCMREYKKDKVLNIIKLELSKFSEPKPIDVLALSVIIQDKGSTDKVLSLLTLLRSHKLVEVLLQHTRLLLDREENRLKLSSLTQTLVEHKLEVFMEVFVLLIGEGTLCLNAFVDAFVNVYPIVSCGIECNLNSLRLRDFIENFFLEFGHLPELIDQREKNDRAIDVLISLYIASLLGAFNTEDEDKTKVEQRSVWSNLFSERPSYLNFFSPFAGQPPSSNCNKNKCKNEDKTMDDLQTVSAGECICQQCCVHLLLLQSLLNSQFPSVENKAAVLKVVTSHPEIVGSSAIRVLCLDPPQQLSYIIEKQPNALVQYCKDNYDSPFEWKTAVKDLTEIVNKTDLDGDKHKIADGHLNDLLNELMVISSFEEFTEIIPTESHNQFRSHIRQSHSAGIAKFLKKTFVIYADNVLQSMTEA